ncbi:hypothetical protein CFN78_28150 [Amycolatopsis antarctica]|uniref:Uncharacterized protein n=1 Tax=Amycolatopsis antarctica TaxID=1854586 RepID=A0A263CV84_9PSEU|nr:hypothetical protein [Amycolatopsis antarctica]OZM69898.1 hypothetical protein CFN78_28150 [Amycolatopsis antarctica]
MAALVDDASGIPRGQLAPDAAIVELYASATPVDELHPIDRLLVESGIALERVRQIAPAGRVSLAGEILARRPPEHTRAARSPQEWLEVAEHRAYCGHDFHQRRSRARATDIARVYAVCADVSRRPLTWVRQQVIADSVGCCDRHVRRYLSWLLQQELLHEVVPATRVPRMASAAAEAARARIDEARAARARAEIEAIHQGATPEQAAAAARREHPDPDPMPEADALVTIAPVYELRVPLDPAELAERAVLDATARIIDQAAEQHVSENVLPPVGVTHDLASSDVRGVDNGPASPDSSTQKGFDQAISRPEGGSATRSSRAERAARRLLDALLEPRLLDGVTLRWLTAAVRPLVLRHGWTDRQLADQIQGALPGVAGTARLPYHVADPRSWIAKRLALACPTMPPQILADVDEHVRTVHARRRSLQASVSITDEAIRRRAAAAACRLCDELGWLAAGDQVARCTHDADNGGW